jgi:membrane fusion protein (multidrug efflux system)
MDDETASAEVGSARPSPPVRPAGRKLLKWGIAAVVLVGVIVAAIVYWTRYVSTENAYVNANRIHIAAQVSGPIVAVQVRDQQHVKKGDLLVEIDPRSYQIAGRRSPVSLLRCAEWIATWPFYRPVTRLA